MFMPISRRRPGHSKPRHFNAGVVVGDSGVFVIDATAGPMHAKNFISAVRKSYR